MNELKEFKFKTNEDFNNYIASCGSGKLLKLYRYGQDLMKNGEVGAMIDNLVIYPKLIEFGYSRKDLI